MNTSVESADTVAKSEIEATPETTDTPGAGSTGSRWLKRAGVAAFLFFFIKGLVWIGVGVGAYVAIR